MTRAERASKGRGITVDVRGKDGKVSSFTFDPKAPITLNLPPPFRVPPSAAQDVGEGLNLLTMMAAAGAVGAGAVLAAPALPEVGPAAYGALVDAATAAETPAGQVALGYLTSKLGNSGIDGSQPWFSLGGMLDTVADSVGDLFSIPDAF
jgi:hypothetical protein